MLGAKSSAECTRETNTFIEMQFSYEDANSAEKKATIEAGVVSSIVEHSATSADDIWLQWSDNADAAGIVDAVRRYCHFAKTNTHARWQVLQFGGCFRLSQTEERSA